MVVSLKVWKSHQAGLSFLVTLYLFYWWVNFSFEVKKESNQHTNFLHFPTELTSWDYLSVSHQFKVSYYDLLANYLPRSSKLLQTFLKESVYVAAKIWIFLPPAYQFLCNLNSLQKTNENLRCLFLAMGSKFVRRLLLKDLPSFCSIKKVTWFGWEI